MTEIVKVCKKHGELCLDQVRKDGKKLRCKICRTKTNRASYEKNREKRVATSMRWKQQNRGDYNQWLRDDRKKFPEKYKRYEQNYIKKHGIEKIRLYEVLRIKKLKLEDYKKMVSDQDNKCAICLLPETRKSRVADEPTQLSIDHCHKTEKVRGLLCHSCNTGIGKFKDDTELLKRAILYLEKHSV